METEMGAAVPAKVSDGVWKYIMEMVDRAWAVAFGVKPYIQLNVKEPPGARVPVLRMMRFKPSLAL